MSDFSERIPGELENPPPPADLLNVDSVQAEPHVQEPWFASSSPQQAPEDDSPLLFESFTRPGPVPQERIPHIGHLLIVALLAIGGLVTAGLLARLGVHFHVFGISTMDKAATDIRYTLGTEGIFYCLTFAVSAVLFPLLWQKRLFEGLHWRGNVALERSGYLIGAAVVCFIFAVLSGMMMPGPEDAPIDRIFRMPGAAWLLFAFGVTLAPFFEEVAFRGFLLPALCTAFDWTAEKTHHQSPHPLDENGHPQWSMPAMIVAAIITSLLFAFMHADQTGYSFGPFLLLCCVSLVLCWIRLGMRSLAASVLVHASYNFFLFSLMLIGTSGFKHLDRM